ncbi:MAG TPA: PEP-CTERM sorting domain-containing protein [Lacipirellulaceae bacterium]|nr:PEP-CTERM sorting domain-containing protein [Lacipirellulaceae bacterium]
MNDVVRPSSALAALVAAFVLAEIGYCDTVDFSINAPQVIFSSSQRKSAGGSLWPDGNIGVVSDGNGLYDFYSANGPSPVKTTGTLTNPGGSKKSVSIKNVPKAFDYVAGGPVYQDPYSGARIMVYHAELQNKSFKNYYSELGLAISTDGQTFKDLGIIIKPNVPSGQTDVGGGSFAIVNGYFNVYYRDFLADGSRSEVAVARAPIADLLQNSLMGRSTAFTKYYNGGWSQPGIGGIGSALEVGNPFNSWSAASYNTYLNQVVLVSSQWTNDGGDLYMATSSDGVNFSPRQALAADPGEQFYPSIVGTGADPSQSGQSFYVYYTDSKKGGFNRPTDALLLRRQVTVNSPSGGPASGSSVLSAGWTPVAGYRDEFQTGAPAQGWKYAWDPKGKLGNSAAYVSLVWSSAAQTYNTTGGATDAPAGKKTHTDDYLNLGAIGGCPGQSKYTPIIGYTIQADDGEGYYRLADSSIQKTNGTIISKEDGLQVYVYVNNTLIGSAQSVSANGASANFDRTLGALHVGDTVWVMVDPLKNQIDDTFVNFDFSLQRLVYGMQSLAVNGFANFSAGAQLMASNSVPEPASVALLFIAIAAGCMPRRRRR